MGVVLLWAQLGAKGSAIDLVAAQCIEGTKWNKSSLAGVVPIAEGRASRKTPSSRDTSAVLSAQIKVLELSDNPSEPLSPDGEKAREPLSSGGSSSPLHDEARGEGAAEGGASYKMHNSD